MNFLENIVVSSIMSAVVVHYKNQDKSKMNSRPVHGIAFALNGSMSYFHNEKEIILCGNRVVLIPQGATYEVVCSKGGSFAVINFSAASSLDISEFVTLETPNIDIIRNDFWAIYNSYINNQTHKTYNNFSLLYKIFSLLDVAAEKQSLTPAVIKAVSFIKNNITNPELTNTQIAEYAGISEVYLRKLFSAHLSTSVNKYIQDIRIEKSKKLLSETNLCITEISEKCGFSSIYYFCRSFKNKTGLTPTEYRNEAPSGLF